MSKDKSDKKPKKQKEEISYDEKAQIVITLRGNPNPVLVRYNNLEDGKADFSSAEEYMALRVSDKDKTIIFTGVTWSIIRLEEIAAISFADMEKYTLLMAPKPVAPLPPMPPLPQG